jgi:hypothetical protein
LNAWNAGGEQSVGIHPDAVSRSRGIAANDGGNRTLERKPFFF